MRKTLRLPHEGPPERDPLALPAGELARLALEQLADVERLRGRVDPATDLASRHLAHLETEREVVAHGHLRIERVVLEDHRDVAAARRHLVDDVVADPDVPAGQALEARRGAAAQSSCPIRTGPTSTMNSPSAISSDSSCNATTSPKCFTARSIGHRCHAVSLSPTRRPCRG